MFSDIELEFIKEINHEISLFPPKCHILFGLFDEDNVLSFRCTEGLWMMCYPVRAKMEYDRALEIFKERIASNRYLRLWEEDYTKSLPREIRMWL